MSVLHIVHTTSMRYAGAVSASYNEARMKPLTQPGQTVLDARVDVRPHTWVHEYRDYWGTAVTAFEVLAPHTTLVIAAESRVEVTDRTAPGPACGWDTLDSDVLRDRMAEFLTATARTEVPDEVADLARDVVGGRDLAPDEAAVAICAALRDELEYVPGVTAVQTVAREAWLRRSGVCQDISHLAAGALRSVGIPARYVSGYLDPRRGEVPVGEGVVGQSHAWIEWWAGDWRGYDPTNRGAAGPRHVVLGRGREYGDVAPLRGVFTGGTSDGLSVEVRIIRES